MFDLLCLCPLSRQSPVAVTMLGKRVRVVTLVHAGSPRHKASIILPATDAARHSDSSAGSDVCARERASAL